MTTPPPPKKGPVFDTALRRMIEVDPIQACHLLGIPVTAVPRVISAAMPSGTLSADLILDLGRQELAHVEYMRDVTADLVARMLIYRGLIMREHPDKRLLQHIIVLGRGSVRGYDDLPGRGFALDLTVHYLREIPPATLLSDPGLAPLAALGRGSAEDRERAYAAAMRLIHERGGERTRELLEFATVLATIRLDRNTIDTIVKEFAMTVESIAAEFEPTWFGQELVALGRARGREEGP